MPAASPPEQNRCLHCEHWEPNLPEGWPKLPRSVALDGYCPLFQKITKPDHGAQCTAWNKLTILEK
jgi:hypothetical protein